MHIMCLNVQRYAFPHLLLKLCEPSVAVDNTLKLWYTVWRQCHIMQSNPDTAPPSLSGHDCLWTELIIQYFNWLPPSIQHHKLQWTNSGTVSGFNCISFHCRKVGSDQRLQVTGVIRCYVMTTCTHIFPEVTGSLTLSDPTSDLVRHYDFPVPLRCRKTSDTFLLRPLRCRSLSDAFPHVVRTLANR